jgi:ribosome-associated translation inhibitor RaiA
MVLPNPYTFIRNNDILTIKKYNMTIEFQTAYGKVSEKLITSVRNELLQLSHSNKAIHKAEVIIKIDEAFITAQNKICEIILNIYGENIRTRARTENFEKSAKDALKKMTQMVIQQEKKHHEKNYTG